MKAQVYQVYPKGTEYTKYPRRLQNRAKTKYIPSVANEAPKRTNYKKYPQKERSVPTIPGGSKTEPKRSIPSIPHEAPKGTKYTTDTPMKPPKGTKYTKYPQKEPNIPSIPGGSRTKPKRSIYQPKTTLTNSAHKCPLRAGNPRAPPIQHKTFVSQSQISISLQNWGQLMLKTNSLGAKVSQQLLFLTNPALQSWWSAIFGTASSQNKFVSVTPANWEVHSGPGLSCQTRENTNTPEKSEVKKRGWKRIVTSPETQGPNPRNYTSTTCSDSLVFWQNCYMTGQKITFPNFWTSDFRLQWFSSGLSSQVII